MFQFMQRYVRVVDRMNYRIGRIAMYFLFVMMAILLWSSISKIFFRPSLWTLELAQFAMVTYYIFGGPYALQMGSNVRMDLVYGIWSVRQKAWVDAFTVILLIAFLGFLIYGGMNSLIYAIEYNERSYSPWRPYMWPIKLIMVLGFVLMLLQTIAELFKDIIQLRSDDSTDNGDKGASSNVI